MPPRGKVIRMQHVTRQFVRAHPRMKFVFGDNMIGKGYGGQAASMRGEPNAIGVPTKWAPERKESAYFTDYDTKNADVRHALIAAFNRIEAALRCGCDVVIPSDGLGTGLAELPTRAPEIHRWIEAHIAMLELAGD